MTLEIQHTEIFNWNYEALNNDGVRFIVNQGGSRSSKTYSICQLLIVHCLQNPNIQISIVRKSFPALRGSVMRDFFEVMKHLDIYNPERHHKSSHEYTFDNGSVVEFFSADDEQKLRGRKRDILWCNEANELSFNEFNQLNMRTANKLFFDFNPSDDDHWLYELSERPNATIIKSTYKNNPFLNKEQVKEIEDLINVDYSYYQVYALGMPSTTGQVIYNHQLRYVEDLIKYDETILGLDFGYKHPSALIECNFREDTCFVKELIYESHLTSDDLCEKIEMIFNQRNWSKSQLIVADYARPEMIEDLIRRGFNVMYADKSVKQGIDAVKSYKLFYHEESFNIAKEFRNYKWKMIGEKITDEPIKLFDDAMDAIRYAILYHKKTKRSFGGWDFANF